MAGKRATLRTKWLGRTLKELRAESDHTLGEAAEYLKRDQSVMSRMETGALPVPSPVVEALLNLYGIDDPARRESLMYFAAQAWRSDWWDGYADDAADTLIDYVWLESQADRIQAFSATAIDGLLQTADYARALIDAANIEGHPQKKVDRWVELRMMRQAMLSRSEPAELRAVIPEEAIRRPIGSTDIMIAQLNQLIAAMGRDNIEVRVLPYATGAHVSPDGKFRVFDLPAPLTEIVCIESPGGQLYIEPPKSSRFTAMYDALEQAALDQEHSAELIETIRDELHQR